MKCIKYLPDYFSPIIIGVEDSCRGRELIKKQKVNQRTNVSLPQKGKAKQVAWNVKVVLNFVVFSISYILRRRYTATLREGPLGISSGSSATFAWKRATPSPGIVMISEPVHSHLQCPRTQSSKCGCSWYLTCDTLFAASVFSQQNCVPILYLSPSE